MDTTALRSILAAQGVVMASDEAAELVQRAFRAAVDLERSQPVDGATQVSPDDTIRMLAEIEDLLGVALAVRFQGPFGGDLAAFLSMLRPAR
jgi:hypothetical protein